MLNLAFFVVLEFLHVTLEFRAVFIGSLFLIKRSLDGSIQIHNALLACLDVSSKLGSRR